MTTKEPPSPVPAQAFPEQAAGKFSAWLRGIKRAQEEKAVGNDVPCGSCIACCRASMFIHVRPDETEALRRIPKALLFPAPGAPPGHRLLGFNERGECPMLREGRCSIYEHRPQTCRDFDCRVFAATGITPADPGPQSEIARRARAWRFDVAADEDREQYTAAQAAGAFLCEQRDAFPADVLPRTPVQLAVLAVEIYQIFAQRGAELAAKSNAEIAREVLAVMEQCSARDTAKPSKRASPRRGKRK